MLQPPPPHPAAPGARCGPLRSSLAAPSTATPEGSSLARPPARSQLPPAPSRRPRRGLPVPRAARAQARRLRPLSRGTSLRARFPSLPGRERDRPRSPCARAHARRRPRTRRWPPWAGSRRQKSPERSPGTSLAGPATSSRRCWRAIETRRSPAPSLSPRCCAAAAARSRAEDCPAFLGQSALSCP